VLGRSRNRDRGRGAGVGGINLLNSATIYLGGVAPYHWLDFINNRALYASVDVGNVTGGTGYSFTRASDGYYTNSDGTLTLFGSGALRRGDRGVLIEGARTNLLVRSQEFDNAAWVKSNATVTANVGAAPDGTTTADQVTATGADGYIIPSSSLFAAAGGATFVYSVFAKAGTATTITLLLGATANYVGTFNLSTGVASTSSANTTVSMTNAGSGWYRCVLTCAAVASIGYAEAQIGRVASGLTFSLWGAQLEQASFQSSYIPTVAAAATRAADSLVYTAGVSYPASLWCEFDRGVASALGQVALQLDGGDDTNRSTIRANASGEAEAVMASGAVTQAQMSVAGAMTPGTASKVGARYSTNSVQIARAGTLGTEDTSATVPAAITTLRLGARAAGDQYLFGYVARAAVFNSALTNANLQTVST
jgi:hypothetical protein